MDQTNPSWKRPLILAAVLAAGGLISYWYEYSHRPKKEEAEEQGKKLFALKDRGIDTITLFDGRAKYTFHCLDLAAKLCKPGDQSKWELLEPFKQPADSTNVNALVSTLNNTTSSDSLDLKTESTEKRASLLKEYLLDSNARTSAKNLQLKLSDGQILSAFLGASNPVDQSVYALLGTGGNADETKVLLMPSFFVGSFGHNLTYWRDKKLVSLETAKIEGFELNSSKDSVTGERKNGEWTLISKKRGPTAYPGDTENIDGLIAGVTYLTAKEFPDASVLKGAKPTLSILFKTPAPVGIRVYEKSGKEKSGADKKAYATVDGSQAVFEIDPSSANRLDKSLKDLRLTRFISSLERFGIKKIEISGKPVGDKPLVLSAENSKWMVAEKDVPSSKAEANSEKVQTLLDKLAGNRVEDFVEGSKIPPGEQDGVEISLSNEKGEKPRRLLFWTKDYKLYAKDLLSKRIEAFVVDTTVSTALPWAKDFFKKGAETPKTQPKAAP